ncbi:hypothetical protein HPB51_024806 [Rhipicephalus microplus]|uniref:Uncharacterized protein n=1 Tax=Rhipicephalus microplus TaxID=6941 RepID=A0A9J6F8B6_RHIMP|nr:hypothetical protein HPB51_024806 [Rhipicephalus microplus]
MVRGFGGQVVDAASPPGAASSSFPAAGGQSATLVGEIWASEMMGDGRAAERDCRGSTRAAQFDITNLVKQPGSFSDMFIGLCTAANPYIRPPRPTFFGHGTVMKTVLLPMLLFQAMLSCFLPCFILASTSNAWIDSPMDLLTAAATDLLVQHSFMTSPSLSSNQGHTVTCSSRCAGKFLFLKSDRSFAILQHA